MRPAEFLGYGLWDTSRPARDRFATLSDRDRAVLEPLMNPAEACRYVCDKAWTAHRLEHAGVATAPTLALASLDPGTEPLTGAYPMVRGYAAVAALLSSIEAPGAVLKPVDGAAGRGVVVFRDVARGGPVHLDGTVWSWDRVERHLSAESIWKIERRLETHPRLAAIAGETLGTARLTTFRTRDGTIHLTPSTWKIPIGNSGVDHFAHGTGQLAAPIDRAKGTIGWARSWRHPHVVEHHPVTGVRFVGAEMPFWSEAVDLVSRAAACLPDLASLGFDVAITAEGPVIVDVNDHWGPRMMQQAWQRGLVQGDFLAFLEELGAEEVINRTARGIDT
jgi:hypothetical protein